MAVDVATPRTRTRRARTPRAPVARWGGAAVLGLLLLVALLTRALDPGRIGWLQNLLIVFGSLLEEAMPFILLGATVSAAIEVLVPSSAFAKLGLLPRGLQLPAAAAAGMAFPVCECGSVPVARRLASKGLAPGAAITFMLAAPIVNPVVIASTFVAYRGRDTLWLMVIGRFVLGFMVAIAVGWVIGALKGSVDLLRTPTDEVATEEAIERSESRWRRFAGHLAGDVVFMTRFLVIGALIAAAVQTFVPQSVVDRVAGLPIISLVAMMLLAFLMSLCSESDAFVAASFVAFGPAAQLAFLVSGPMIDVKLGALYAGTYKRGFVRTATIAIFVTTLVFTMWIQVIWG